MKYIFTILLVLGCMFQLLAQDAIYYKDNNTYQVLSGGYTGDMGCTGYYYEFAYNQINVSGSANVAAFQNGSGQSKTVYGEAVYLKTNNAGTFAASQSQSYYGRDAGCSMVDSNQQPQGWSYSFKVEDFYFNAIADMCQPAQIDLNNYIPGVSVAQRYYLDGAQIGNVFDSNSVGAGSHTIRIDRDYAQGTIQLSRSFTVYAPAAIGTQPTNASGCPTGGVSFGITVSGSNLSVTWEESYNGGGSWATLTNGGVYSNTTTTNMNISNIAGKTSYIYRAKVVGTCNTVYSNNASLTVYGQVGVAASPPADIWKCRGEIFNISVGGTPRNGAINYMWQYKFPAGSWTDWGYTTAINSYVVPADGSHDGLQVRARLRDDCGAATENYTSVGTIHMYTATTTTNPSSPSVCAGSNASFSVTASGQGPFTYQWYENGTALSNNAVYSGTATASLTVIGATLAFSGKGYTCKVTGLCNNVTSAAGTLTVANPPSITADPGPVNTCSGTSASFNVAATGSSLQYQWAFSASGGIGTYNNISGAQSATYTIASVGSANNGFYQVKVFNSICSSPVTSGSATLQVLPITTSTNPANAGICPGGNATFSVTAGGSGTVTYQWQKALAATPTVFTNLSGQVFNTLTITNVSVTESGTKYRVIVHSNCGSDVTTTAGTLTVNAIPSAPTAASVSRCGTGSLSATASSPASSPSYKWYANESDVTPIFTGATYTVASLGTTTTFYVSVVSSCESPKTAVVFTRNTPRNVPMGPALSLCVAQGVYNLANDIVDIAAKGGTFTWTANGVSFSGNTFNPNVGPGVYVVTYTPTSTSQATPNCYLVTQRTITVVSGGGDGGITFGASGGVVVNSGNTINSCVGSEPIILSDLPSAPGGDWSTVAGVGLSFNGVTAVFTPNANSFTSVTPNTFRYSLNLNGCSVSKDLNIYVKDNTSKPNISGLPTIVCPDTDLSLAVSVTNPGTYTYEWNKVGQAAFSTVNPLPFKVVTNEVLEVRSINTFGCRSESSQVSITTPFSSGNIEVNKATINTGDFIKFSYSANNTNNSYEWDFGDAEKSFSQNPAHYYFTPGAYTVKLKVASALGCNDNKEFKTITVNGEVINVVTAVEPLILGEKISFYPNPVESDLTVKAGEKIISLAITDMRGTRLVNSQPNSIESKLDLSGLTAGMYLVHVQTVKDKAVLKIIKK